MGSGTRGAAWRIPRLPPCDKRNQLAENYTRNSILSVSVAVDGVELVAAIKEVLGQ